MTNERARRANDARRRAEEFAAGLCELVRQRPGRTLAELLGRVPSVTEVRAANRLVLDGRLTRDASGRYAPDPAPRTPNLRSERGHGISASNRPHDKRAPGKSRKGHS
jgi:hypothetical protein